MKEARSPSSSRVIRVDADPPEDSYTPETDNEQDNNTQTVGDRAAAESEDDDSTDYTDTDTGGDEPADDDETSDYTEDVETDDATEDDTTDSEDDGPSDYTDDAGGDDSEEETDGGDEQNPDEGSEEEQKEDPDANSNLALMYDSIKLYESVRMNISKLNDFSNGDIVTNKIVIQVRKNLTSLLHYIYQFITKTFSKNTYVQNLYAYTYFVEAYKINVELLKKINTFASNQ